LEEFGSRDQVPDGYPTELSIMGEPTYLQVQRLKAEGLDWLIGITIPRRDLTAQSERNTNLIIIFSIFATGLSVGLGILVARQIMEPLDVLSEQAEAIANDDLSIDLEPLQKLKAQNNELAAFARILEKTAKEVFSRTKAMKAEIKTLKVEIDQQKKEKQVKEIIETDFFKELELKAKTLRDRY
jgi:methyl-accepting chemotaxis protein